MTQQDKIALREKKREARLSKKQARQEKQSLTRRPFRYGDPSTAPLRFHRFYSRVCVPLSILLLVINIVRYTLKILPFEGFALADAGSYYAICHRAILLILYIRALYGLLKWKPYAWKRVIRTNIVSLVFAGLSLVADIFFHFTPPLLAALKIIAKDVFAVCVIAYYVRRKPLFYAASLPAGPSR